jgi:hypothetical protein
LETLVVGSGSVKRDLPSSDPGPEPNSESTGGEDRAQEGRATLIENTQGESKAKGAKRRESEREKSEVWRFNGEKIMCGVRCDCTVSEGVGGL